MTTPPALYPPACPTAVLNALQVGALNNLGGGVPPETPVGDILYCLQTSVSPSVGLPNSVPFTYATPSPAIMVNLAPGNVIDVVEVTITTPFNDPAASISVGTVATPGLLLPPISPVTLGTFGNDENFKVAIPEILRLTINPGASTQGAGYLLYLIRTA